MQSRVRSIGIGGRLRLFAAFFAVVLFAAYSNTAAVAGAPSVQNGMSILKAKCVGCHDIKGPAAKTLKDFNSRKGPDLFYAGNKYNEEWVIKWLENPVPIRPAGFRYYENTVTSEGADDTIDWDSLPVHTTLTGEEAESVAGALMTFRAYDKKIKKNALTDIPADTFMGEMNFDKFSGCLACHEIEPGYGGVTGPEVYTTAQRLQPDFIYSYLKEPQAFDLKSFMPNKELGENFLQVLTKYMLTLEAPVLEDEDADEKSYEEHEEEQ